MDHKDVVDARTEGVEAVLRSLSPRMRRAGTSSGSPILRMLSNHTLADHERIRDTLRMCENSPKLCKSVPQNLLLDQLADFNVFAPVLMSATSRRAVAKKIAPCDEDA
ncbi:unnamed protein product, partial [Amoebophrya sp. A25]|eukprot:GSA25T00022330001.1